MQKRRRRPKKTAPLKPLTGERLRRVEVDTTRLVQIDSLEDLEDVDVDGAIVKVAPQLTAQQKTSYDAAATKQYLKSRGAIAVISAPTVVRAAKRDKRPTRHESPRELAARWMKRQRVKEVVRTEASGMLDAAMSAEGL